jgi:hypothetical protein
MLAIPSTPPADVHLYLFPQLQPQKNKLLFVTGHFLRQFWDSQPQIFMPQLVCGLDPMTHYE